MKKKILKITLSIVLILILAVGIGLTYLVGAAGGGGPFDFVWKNKLKKMPGNAEKYSLENIEPLENSPLGGKRICYLGSSVTLGLYSMDVSFADYISYRNGCEYVKEAVSGTMNCSPSSRQLKKYKFFLPAEISLLAVFMQLASKFHVFPLVLKFQDSFANVCCCSNLYNLRSFLREYFYQ